MLAKESKNMNSLIAINKVFFHYPGMPNILENVDLLVEKGDFIALTGPNGSAKTTLLKLIIGLLKPQAGTIELFGQDIGIFKDWYKIGYVPQKTNFFNPDFPASVQEIISLNKLKQNILGNRSALQNRVEEVLELVSLREKRKEKIGELSGGEVQRVLIARSLINRPEILLLDEPTANLDMVNQEKLNQLLKDLNDNLNLTIVLVTHDLKVKRNAKRVLELVEGTLREISQVTS
jgi:zinc transport system ATP-binding protein